MYIFSQRMPRPLCIYIYISPKILFYFILFYFFFEGKEKFEGDSPRLHAAIDVLRSAAGWRGRLRLWRRPVSLAKARHHLRVGLRAIFDFTRHRPCHWLRTKVPVCAYSNYCESLIFVHQKRKKKQPPSLFIYRNCWHGSFFILFFWRENLVASGPMSVRFLYGFWKLFFNVF